MKKKIPPAKNTRKSGKKSGKDITTTSVAFKTENIEGLKRHDLHIKNDLSVSWIINKLTEKFLEGAIPIDVLE